MNPQDSLKGPALSEADQAALDEMFQIGGNAGGAAGAKESRVARLLALLGAGTCKIDRSLSDVTLARIMLESIKVEKANNQGSGSGLDHAGAEPTLCPRDADALDAWELARFDASKTPGGVRERAERHESLKELATGAGAEEFDASLVERTMSRIEAVPARSLKFVPVTETGGAGVPWMRWRELVSVAAVLLIAASVVWPVASAVRDRSRRMMCEGNFATVASAMARYANDNHESMPIAAAGLGASQWFNVQPQAPTANSANLYKLPLTGYSKLKDLACPGNPQACLGDCPKGSFDWPSLSEISYSLQLLRGATPTRLTEPGRRVVLADRSPVVRRMACDQPIDPWENSDTHGRQGQNVLYNDGSSEWMTTPVRDGWDNIWLPSAFVLTREVHSSDPTPGGKDRPTFDRLTITLQEIPTPMSPIDAFVGP